jgi:hypothetical protein
MKTPPPLGQTICLKFCAYYKPGKNEELECRGYTVVEQLIQSGMAGVFDAFEKEADPSATELIVQKICMNCDFHERDCDFMQDRATPPCGGLVLLTQLLKRNRISLEDIAKANKKIVKGT